MVAANIMRAAPFTLREDSTLNDLLKALTSEDSKAIPVIDSANKAIGVIPADRLLKELVLNLPAPGGPREIVRNMAGLGKKPVTGLMDKAFAHCSPDTPATGIAAAFDGDKAGIILVVDDNMRLLGVITPGDLLKRLWEYKEKETR
ncbi:MAG: CBS domain-containing protein [Deltaproteobacteria bacterium]|nr:CBS domain-containing protein [Deltaproteobacteria bacterium]